MKITEQFLNRFWAKVKKSENGCWEWTAATASGYGRIRINGNVESAHRISYMIHFNESPGHLLVCHKCDNKLCVNPGHLFLGSYSDNLKDAIDKGINTPPTGGRKFEKGHKPKNKRLSDEEAAHIKMLILNRGNKTLNDIAKETGVPASTIKDISSGRSYVNIRQLHGRENVIDKAA